MRLSAGFIDTFSTAIDDLPRADQANQLKVLAVLAQTGRFSCFEASANQTIARTMTALMRGPLVESYVPDSYKSKAESGGARGPDRDTYPWTFVRITAAGRAALQTAHCEGS